MINFFIFLFLRVFFYIKKLACFEIHKRHGDWFFSPPDGGNNIVYIVHGDWNLSGTSRVQRVVSASFIVIGSCDPALFFIAGLWLDSQRKIGWEYTSIYMTIEKDFLSPSPTLYIVRGWRGFSPLPKARLLCDGYTQENERNRWDLL
jgi:hypothetical protein